MPFVTATAVPPFFLGSDQYDKSDNLELRTSHEVSGVSLKTGTHLRVVLAVAY
jgi:hypothetical protein